MCISTCNCTGITNISKLIVGHKGAMSITESVYTHIEMSELIKAIDSVYYPEEIIKEVKKSKKRSKHYER